MRYITFSSQSAAEKQRRRALARQRRVSDRINENKLLRSNTPEGSKLAERYQNQVVRENRQDRIRELSAKERQRRLSSKAARVQEKIRAKNPRPVVDIRPRIDARPVVDLRPTVNATPKVDVRPTTPTQPRSSGINLQRTAEQNAAKSSRSQAYRHANRFRPLKRALTGKWARRGAIGAGLVGAGAVGTALTMGALRRRERNR